jgi:hypothetical protein
MSKRVKVHVGTLEELRCEDGGVSAPYDAITAEMRL